MNNKKVLMSAFILLAMVQLYVPARMIWNKEKVLDNGTDFKFKTAPVDPIDPFRGKYITLYFEANTFRVEDANDWKKDETVCVYLTKDHDGFAEIHSISKEELGINQPYVKAKLGFVASDGSNMITIEYPFNRYYMEETKAYEAELFYMESQIETSHLTYALVCIENGEAVLKDVLINDKPIRELVEENRKRGE